MSIKASLPKEWGALLFLLSACGAGDRPLDDEGATQEQALLDPMRVTGTSLQNAESQFLVLLTQGSDSFCQGLLYGNLVITAGHCVRGFANAAGAGAPAVRVTFPNLRDSATGQAHVEWAEEGIVLNMGTFAACPNNVIGDPGTDLGVLRLKTLDDDWTPENRVHEKIAFARNAPAGSVFYSALNLSPPPARRAFRANVYSTQRNGSLGDSMAPVSWVRSGTFRTAKCFGNVDCYASVRGNFTEMGDSGAPMWFDGGFRGILIEQTPVDLPTPYESGPWCDPTAVNHSAFLRFAAHAPFLREMIQKSNQPSDWNRLRSYATADQYPYEYVRVGAY